MISSADISERAEEYLWVREVAPRIASRVSLRRISNFGCRMNDEAGEPEGGYIYAVAGNLG